MKISNINSNIFHRGRRNLKSDSWQLTVIAYENAKSITLNLFSPQELGIGTVALFFWQQRRKRKKMQLKAIIPKLQKNYTHIQNIFKDSCWDPQFETSQKSWVFLVKIFEFCPFVRSTISDTVEFLSMEIFEFCRFVINTFTWYRDLYF